MMKPPFKGRTERNGSSRKSRQHKHEFSNNNFIVFEDFENQSITSNNKKYNYYLINNQSNYDIFSVPETYFFIVSVKPTIKKNNAVNLVRFTGISLLINLIYQQQFNLITFQWKNSFISLK